MESPSTSEMQEVVQLVTSTFVQRDVTPMTKPAAELPEKWIGRITLNGSFEVVVKLTTSRKFAHALASSIFPPPEDATEEAARDSLAELTNVVGGNLKSLYSATRGDVCKLSLPEVQPADAATAEHAKLVHAEWWACGEDAIEVSIYEAKGGAAE